MKIIKYILLQIILLIALTLCGIVVVKIFDVVLKLQFESIWITGVKAGFMAWLGLSVVGGITAVKKRKTQGDDNEKK